MNKEQTYLHLLRQFTFVAVVLLIMIKPMVSLINHLSNNNDDIELIEDFDEEDSEKEIEFDEALICSHSSDLPNGLSISKSVTRLYIMNQCLERYKDILIPPPKSRT